MGDKLTYEIVKENTHPATTDTMVEIAQWAANCAPCQLRIKGDGIRDMDEGGGYLMTIEAGASLDQIHDKLKNVVKQLRGEPI